MRLSKPPLWLIFTLLLPVFSVSPFLAAPHAVLFLRNIIFSSFTTPTKLQQRFSSGPVNPSTDFPSVDVQYLQPVLQACRNNPTTNCHILSLASLLASSRRPSKCSNIYSPPKLIHHVYSGYGCCSDVAKVFVWSAHQLGINARIVHVPRHTTVEYWSDYTKSWHWLDPSQGFQAFGPDMTYALDHMTIFTRLNSSQPVSFSRISSPLPIVRPIQPYELSAYTAGNYTSIYYTNPNLLSLGPRYPVLARLLPKRLILLFDYITGYPPLYGTTSSSQSLFSAQILQRSLIAYFILVSSLVAYTIVLLAALLQAKFKKARVL